MDSSCSAIREEKQIPPGPAESRNTLSPFLQMNGSDGMFKYEEIVLERVSTPYSPTSSLLPLAHPRHSWAPMHPCTADGERLVRSLWRLSRVLHLLCQPWLPPGWACCSPLPLHTPPEEREEDFSLASLLHTLSPTNPLVPNLGGGSLSLPLSESRGVGELCLCRWVHTQLHPTAGHRDHSHPATRLPVTLGHTALGC